jgi:hypothetical protein
MQDLRLNIDEIDDLDMPVAIHGTGADANNDMVIDVVLAVAVYTNRPPAQG